MLTNCYPVVSSAAKTEHDVNCAICPTKPNKVLFSENVLVKG